LPSNAVSPKEKRANARHGQGLSHRHEPLISTASFLVLFSVVVGAALGYRRPIWGFALLAGLVSVTSGLPWHLGLGNLPLNHGFLLGLIAGVGVRVGDAVEDRVGPVLEDERPTVAGAVRQ